MHETAFVIPLWADLSAVAIGGVQGAVYAAQFRDRRLDLLGVAIIGIAAGLGGGLVRDVFLGRIPVALTDNWYVPTATLAALVGMLLERVFTRLATIVTVLDALTIGLFCAIGASKALALGLPAIPAIFLGTISAVGGTIVRDLLLNVPIAFMHVGSLYAVAAAFGATTLVVLHLAGAPILVAAVICVIVTFGIRVLAVFFNWTVPEQRRLERIPRIRRLRRLRRLRRES